MPPALNIEPKLLERVNGAIADIRAGRMVILVDDEDRENEGDLTMAAQFVSPEAINFMATHARGLICLTLTEERERRSVPASKAGAIDPQAIAKLQSAAEEKLKSAEAEWETERNRLTSQVSRLERAVAQDDGRMDHARR